MTNHLSRHEVEANQLTTTPSKLKTLGNFGTMNHDIVLLRCIESNETEAIHKYVHKDLFGTHANGHVVVGENIERRLH
ncbi:hypothetical protein Lal_00035503 [Lupinus albus]|nr:hypothetical protein Lal_00035503 [Lupinus albus]